MASAPMNVALLQQSFDEALRLEPQLPGRFYATFLRRFPEAAPLFVEVPFKVQEAMLFRAIRAVSDSLGDPLSLAPILAILGERHRRYGATPALYLGFGACLLETLEKALGDRWTPEAAEAWAVTYARTA